MMLAVMYRGGTAWRSDAKTMVASDEAFVKGLIKLLLLSATGDRN